MACTPRKVLRVYKFVSVFPIIAAISVCSFMYSRSQVTLSSDQYADRGHSTLERETDIRDGILRLRAPALYTRAQNSLIHARSYARNRLKC